MPFIGCRYKKMSRFTAPILLVIFALSVGCSGALTPESPLRVQTGTPSAVSLSPTTIAVPTMTVPRPVTPTRVPPTPTPTLTSTPTIPPEARLKIHCLDVLQTFPPQANSQGIVILNSHTSPDIFLLNMATGAKTQLAKQNENLKHFAVSPGKERMAYERGLLNQPGGGGKQLVIAAADGQPQKAIPWEKGWVGIPGWLNDEQLIINMAGNDPDEDTAKKPATLLMVNPFTGERRVLPPDFPEISYEYPVLYWEGWSETIYDPTLTRVVYPGPGYVLWDLESNRALATLRSRFLHPPRWSPDGAQFVVAADPDFGEYRFGYELFSVSRDGELITPLTNLKAYYPASDMWGYSWSPQGNRIAFWLSTDPDAVDSNDHAAQRLGVLDLATQEVTDYCIPLDAYRGDPFLGTIPFFASGVTSPIWSPNGQQLIVESRYAQDASRVILVDVVQDFAVQIADTMLPAGWMKSGP